MKKKTLKFMSILIMMVFITSICLSVNNVKADTVISRNNTTSDGGFKYDVYNDNSGSYAVITEYVGSDAATVIDITVPATVGNSIPVKSVIGKYPNSVFHNCTN